MPLTPAITELGLLKERPVVAALLGFKADAIQGAKLDRDELSITVDRAYIQEVGKFLRDRQSFNFLSDLTCTDSYPREPRFEVVYHLLSHSRKERVRLKVVLAGDDAVVETFTVVHPGANYFEREIFDLFGIRFVGHPHLTRILLPDEWEGHPLRKDYPVEGYR
jgi:NADH-quinone oxidoreductase subunit C